MSDTDPLIPAEAGTQAAPASDVAAEDAPSTPSGSPAIAGEETGNLSEPSGASVSAAIPAISSPVAETTGEGDREAVEGAQPAPAPQYGPRHLPPGIERLPTTPGGALIDGDMAFAVLLKPAQAGGGTRPPGTVVFGPHAAIDAAIAAGDATPASLTEWDLSRPFHFKLTPEA